MEPIHTETHGDITLKLYPDTDPMSPADWDTFGTVYSWGDLDIGEHLRFSYTTPTATYLDEDAAEVVWFYADRYGFSETDDPEYANGAIICTHADITREYVRYGVQRSHFAAREALRGVLSEWRQYAEGDVYGYVITRDAGECETCHRDYDPEEVDSCWGFYGYEYALTQAREALQAVAANV